MLWMVIAQTSEVGSLAGASWTAAGLLSAVLSWLLLKHLPAKDAQIDAMIKSKDISVQATIDAGNAAIREIVSQHVIANKLQRDDHQSMMRIVVDHCEKEMNSTSLIMQKELENLQQSIDKLTVVVGELRRTTP